MPREIQCKYLMECSNKASLKCKTCKNNTLRNKEVDFYIEAKDNPISFECPKLDYDGPAEQTAGYKCPVCGEFTNPYAMRDCRCGSCGYKLNV